MALSVGLLGFGTVGQSVARLLVERTDGLLTLTHVFNRNVARKQVDWVPSSVTWTERIEDVLDAGPDVIVEVTGGLEPARSWHERAIEAGIPVVTANKQLIATHGQALLAQAARRGVDLLFEAAVGGGIPVVRGLREGIAGDRLTTVSGILNGTCNYILTRMESAGLPFDAALAEAQQLGFAEADPTDDLEGYDARAKLCILARVGLGLDLAPASVPAESIRTISDDDFVYARRLQATIRQVSRVSVVDGSVEARVGPALVPLTSPLARVIGSQNLIVAGGVYGKETTFSGYGAGGFPTAVAVVSDLLAIARRAGGAPASWPATAAPASVSNLTVAPYYLRLVVRDQPGIIASLASIFSAHGINIDAVLQEPGNTKERLPFVITLEACPTSAMARALREIETLPFHVTPPLCLPVLA
ncbi:homoserine dehydrogenase [Luteitalea sp. TBR-22]|uniref:homoserine dehydrogenase n=1 Tax=Luteitalea sp. TBR-22 TaxID=2802971 RepID=UPI001AF53308|nr:homoserine dehydrogenase [Luteitalea sp. TBR-22]BCS33719.1 homoserine dehydrogenase [Luteitalea sp. TBR-22]